MDKHWITIAGKALEADSATGVHGTKMAMQAEIASSLGVSRQTLRHYADALRFIRAIEGDHPEAAAALRGTTATVVAVYGRWAKRDLKNAMAHAISAAANRLSPREIIADERKARHLDSTPSLLQIAWASVERHQRSDLSLPVRTAMNRQLRKTPALEWLQVEANVQPLSMAMGAVQSLRWNKALAEERLSERLGMDLADETFFRRVSPNGPYDLVAVIESARGMTGDAHRRAARTTLARAALAATVHPAVLVLVADSDALNDFRDTLPPLGDRLLAQSTQECLLLAFGADSGTVMVMPATGFGRAWSGLEPTRAKLAP